MSFRLRVPFVFDVLLVSRSSEIRVLNAHPNVVRDEVASGPLLNRGIQRRLRRVLRVADRPLPVFIGRSDPERARRQRELEAEFERVATEHFVAHKKAIRELADYVAGRRNDVDPGVPVQQIVGRLFDPSYEATDESYEAAKVISRWIGPGLTALWLRASGALRGAKKLLWKRAADDSHAIHGTSIAMHNIVDALLKMRRLATEVPVPSAAEAVRRCLVAPGRVLRACRAETRVPFRRRPLRRGSLVVFQLARSQEAFGNGLAFMDGEWSQCPAHSIIPRLLEEVWANGPGRFPTDVAALRKRGVMRNEYTVNTTDGPVTDIVRLSPVDEVQLRTRRVILLVFLIALGLIGAWAAWRFGTDRPVEYEEITAHFKHGSIGSEPGGSLFNLTGGALPPYWVFRALPAICPEKLPGGYASTGLIFELDDDGEPDDLPIGVSRRHRLGFDQVGFNCAACHTGTVRDSPESEPRIVLGMPSHQLDLHRLVTFILDCSLDERLTADAVIASARAHGDRVGIIDRLLMPSVVDQVRLVTLQQLGRVARSFSDEVPAWGPGRVDTFNTYKSLQFGWRLEELPLSELIGAADFPSIWNQEPRSGMHLHWDGDNVSVDERNLSAALGAGVTPVTIDHPRLQRVRDWIWTLPPPEYPYPIDEALASQGEAIYRIECYTCHGDHRFRDGVVPEGLALGTVSPIDEIGTDPYRLDSYTPMFAATQSMLFPGSPYRFKSFRKTDGYANHPLDGIWARAPYLHNGAVPTLRALLDEPVDRPPVFYRGYDVFDRDNVGFVSDIDAADGRTFFRFDTSVPGNSNAGHTYGTGLSAEQKRALVEYLKKF